MIGVQVGVDDVGDVRDPEADLGESALEPVLGLHPREDLVGVLEAEAVRGIVDVCGMQAGVDEDVFVVAGADQIDGHRDLDQHAVVDPGREDSSLVDPQRARRNHVQPHQTHPAFIRRSRSTRPSPTRSGRWPARGFRFRSASSSPGSR